MNKHVKELTDAANQLPPEERAEVVEGILQSLDATAPEVDRLWAEEARDRLAGFRRGEIEAEDLADAITSHRVGRNDE